MEKNCRNFKTKFWAWIMIFTLVLGGGTYGTSISVKADIIVYVTPTGSKYHTHACGRGNYQPSTLSAAKASGLTPSKEISFSSQSSAPPYVQNLSKKPL